ncbi:MAG TPA: response regulator [Rhizomicrobium sp.]|nr:response regulator [Rhizomicrobium sp.]
MPTSEIAHLSVLVVEDVRATRVIVRAILRSFGIVDVAEASDGQEALTVLGQRHIDVIITDLCMEPMDGVEFIRRLRTPRNGLNPYVPILMVSAHADLAHVTEAIAAGVTEFLSKPIIPANLESRLLSIVRAPKKRISAKTYCGPDRRRSNSRTNSRRRRASDKADAPVS